MRIEDLIIDLGIIMESNIIKIREMPIEDKSVYILAKLVFLALNRDIYGFLESWKEIGKWIEKVQTKDLGKYEAIQMVKKVEGELYKIRFSFWGDMSIVQTFEFVKLIRWWQSWMIR